MALLVIADFLQTFTAWAAAQPDIAGVALAGSHARDAATPASDVDLIILVDNPYLYIADTTWAARFGQAARQEVEDWGGLTSLRVWYTSGLEVEFGWTTPAWAALPLDDGTRMVIAGGFQVLFERGPLLSNAAAEGSARDA